MLTLLTEDIMAFKQSGCGLVQIIEQISLIVYRYPRKTLHWDEDDCSDFFCYFFPKIEILIKRFVYLHKPFEAYLSVSLKYQLRSFMQKKRAKLMEEKIIGYEEYLNQDRKQSDSLGEPLPTLCSPKLKGPLKLSEHCVISHGKTKKRFLFLVLKGALFVDGRLLESIALLTGFDSGWILSCMDSLKSLMKEHCRRFEHLAMRRNRYFVAIYRIHEDLRMETDVEKRRILLALLCEYKMRMEQTIKTINKVPLCPTHREIAQVLGIPKGSVDSGLYYLKNTLTQFLEQAIA